MEKERLDLVLVRNKICESREKAQRMILAGQVRIKDQIVDKPAHLVPPDCDIKIEQKDQFVSRGGFKLQAALEGFKFDVKGLVACDIGASTGGFTDCLLQYGARKVFALDVGRGQLNWKLRQDPRVVVIESCNARYLDLPMVGEKVDLVTIDVSFISLRLILPPSLSLLKSAGRIIALIKPQFEAGRAQVGKGGVVRDPLIRAQIVEDIRLFAEGDLKLTHVGSLPSPILGPAGNQEFLVMWSTS